MNWNRYLVGADLARREAVGASSAWWNAYPIFQDGGAYRLGDCALYNGRVWELRRGPESYGRAYQSPGTYPKCPWEPIGDMIDSTTGKAMPEGWVDPFVMGVGAPGSKDVDGPATAEDFSMSPAQLAALDRKLTPAEQKRVSDWQAGQADAAQAKERAAVYTDPGTGEKRTASTTFTPGQTSRRTYDSSLPPGWINPFAPSAASSSSGRPWWHYVLGAIGVVVVGGFVYKISANQPQGAS